MEQVHSLSAFLKGRYLHTQNAIQNWQAFEAEDEGAGTILSPCQETHCGAAVRFCSSLGYVFLCRVMGNGFSHGGFSPTVSVRGNSRSAVAFMNWFLLVFSLERMSAARDADFRCSLRYTFFIDLTYLKKFAEQVIFVVGHESD